MLRALLLRLVTRAPDGQLVRTRANLRLIAHDAEHAAIVERFVAARLVVSHDEAFLEAIGIGRRIELVTGSRLQD